MMFMFRLGGVLKALGDQAEGALSLGILEETMGEVDAELERDTARRAATPSALSSAATASTKSVEDRRRVSALEMAQKRLTAQQGARGSGAEDDDDEAEEAEGEGEYVVERLLDERRSAAVHGGKCEFLVKWKSYGDETWEPEEHVDDCGPYDDWVKERKEAADALAERAEALLAGLA